MRARAATRAVREESQVAAAAAAARAKPERAAKSRAKAQVRIQARQAAKKRDAAAAAAELNALTAAAVRELARLDAATLRALGTDPLARHTYLALTPVPSRCGDDHAAQFYLTTADHPPPLCTSLGPYQPRDPMGERTALCAQK